MGEPDGRPRLPACRVVACWDQPYALEIGTRGKPERYVYLRAALRGGGGGVPDAWAGGCSPVFRIPWPDGLCGHAGPQEQGAREGHTALDSRGLFTSLPAWHRSRASVPTASAPAGPVSAGSAGEACWGTSSLAGMAWLAAGPLVVLDGREQQVWDFCALGSPSFVLASSWALSEAPRIERRVMVIP